MIHLLRTIHIIAGVIWVGGVFFLAAFVLPSARAVGPASGPMMGQLTQVRQVPRFLLYAGFLTIGAGFWLYWIASASGNPGWMSSGPAKVYGVGAIFAVAAWITGMTLSMPLAKRTGAFAARISASGAPPTAEDQAQLAAMQARLGTLASIAAALLLLSTAAMAVARYVS